MGFILLFGEKSIDFTGEKHIFDQKFGKEKNYGTNTT